MKKTLLILLIAGLAGCTSRTEFGDCIGIADTKKPDLEYKVSALNLVIGIVFFGLVVPPVYVLVDQTFCPVAKKQ